jgi:uridine phosphorylase
VCGARIFFGLGWAGSLQPSAPIGTFLVPGDCIREEGTSQHYLAKDVKVAPDDQLVAHVLSIASKGGLEVQSGRHWTTDAPYRELRNRIQEYKKQGVLGVDMETSAMYALGQYRGVRVCNLLVVSDELWQEWLPAFGSPQLRESTVGAQELIMRCLEVGVQEKSFFIDNRL